MPQATPTVAVDNRSDHYYQVKTMIFSALIDTIDLAQLAQLDVDSAREEIRDIVNEIITIKSVVMSIAEQEQLLTDICNDVLGYGPLEPLLARDDIADIMVNGASASSSKSPAGSTHQCALPRQCAADEHLPAHRQPGRPPRRRKLSCRDARLPDGSRVNVIAPPLSLDGPTLTIRNSARTSSNSKISCASARLHRKDRACSR